MKLQNLPKDLLVELVSELQDRKEKEYSEYIVIYRGGSNDPVIWHFHNEHELKGWILFELFKYPTEIPENGNIWLFMENLSKFPKYQYHRHTEYCKNKSSSFQLDELLILFNKINRDFVIIKGKCISGNTNTIQEF